MIGRTVEGRPAWPARVKLLAGMAGAVLALAGTLVGMIVKPIHYFEARDAAQAELSRGVEAVGHSVEALQRQVQADHDATEREIQGVQQSQGDATRARDAQMVHVADKIEAIETDVGRIQGQLGFFIKNPRQP